MNLLQFLNLVLPDKGYRCAAVAKNAGFAHHVKPDNTSIAKRINWLSRSADEDIFIACGSLKDEFIMGKDARGNDKKMRRTRNNIAYLHSFWLDIDCGPNKDYSSQVQGLTALKEFLEKTQLPMPLVVNSGYGLHVYFLLTDDVTVESWEKIAALFHELTRSLGLRVDPKRTRDPSSVLRPVTTYNKKDPDSPKLVSVIPTDYKATPFLEFAKKIVALINKFNITITAVHSHSTPLDNDPLTANMYQNNDSAHLIANACPAMQKMRDTKGNIHEPLWYDLIGVLRHTIEGADIIQEWSSGHPNYSPESTSAKIQQHINGGYGPTSCAHIHDYTEASSLCENCPHFGSITSPIQLGKELHRPPSITEVVIEEKNHFEPRDVGLFELTEDGVYFKNSFEPGHKVEQESKVCILDYPLIVKTSAEDERRGGLIEIQCKHPNKGVHSFFMEKLSLAEKRTFNRELLKHHIALSAAKVDLMRDYAISYLQELDKQSELQMLYNTMGWKEEDKFVLGAYCLQRGKAKNPNIIDAHLEDSFCKYIKPIGDINRWAEATKYLGAPGLERHALSLLWGFGAPLMRFTGYAGAFVNLVGESNAGKTTMAAWATSIYGDFEQLKAQKNDTYNSLMSRVGNLKNLPFVIDEITNIDFKEVSDLIHSVSQGREKTRLNKSAGDVKPRSWNTIAIGTSNSSLTDKLLVAKDDPEAERLRLVEYWMAEQRYFNLHSKRINQIIRNNYGGIGHLYIQYVLDNIDTVKALLSKVQKELESKTEALGKERFWMAAFSAAITGGAIAKSLGLIHYELQPVIEEIHRIIYEMRGEMSLTKVDYIDVLGRYLNSCLQNAIFVKYGNNQAIEAVYEPTRDMFVRIEHVDKGKRVFVDRSHIVRWLQKTHVSSSEFVKQLQASGTLVNIRGKKVLGSGWANNPNNAAVPVLEFYLEDEDSLAVQLDPHHLGLVAS